MDDYPLSINPVEIISEPLNLKAEGDRFRVELTWDPPKFTRGESVKEYILYVGVDTDEFLGHFSIGGSYTVYTYQFSSPKIYPKHKVLLRATAIE